MFSQVTSVTCLRGHSLTQTNNLPSIDPEYKTSKYRCDFCDKSFNAETHLVAHCRPCEFDLCPTCYEARRTPIIVPQNSDLKCLKGHVLIQTNNLPNIDPEYKTSKYRCDFCDRSRNAETHPVAHCAPCEFDLCPTCYSDQKPNKWKCMSGHSLYKIRSFIARNASYKDNKYTCDFCKKRLDAEKEPAANCGPCDFDLCPTCCGDQEKIECLCPEGHKIYRIRALEGRNPVYKANGYICKLCKRSLGSDLMPSTNCEICKFNCCPDCFGDYQRKWQEGELQKKDDDIVNNLEKLSIEEKPKKSLEKKGGISEEKLCVVCFETEKNYLFIPCGHFCVCEKCSSDMNSDCPICRGKIQSKIRVYS